MNCTTRMRTKHNSRQGVTLLFTISMIVLFLLMGTTFVVVANDYFKTAVRRARLNSFKVDSVSLLDTAFNDAFRGPSLNDVGSPLRGLDLLSDVYGFGFRGTLSATADTATLGANLVTVSLSDTAFDLRDATTFSLTGDNEYVDGVHSGRVITFISGEAAGYSTRIVSNSVVGGTLQFVIPRDNTGINWNRVGSQDEIIVNGREYSGHGAGGLAGIFDPDATTATGRLGTNSLQPIHIGVPRSTLTNPATGYLADAQSVNEPHDAPDHFNLHLSGRDDDAATVGGLPGNIIPSFQRDRLYSNQIGTNPTANDIRTLTMRPFYLAGDNGSTANADFAYNFIDETDGSLANAINAGLDVDNDNDGTNDSVWIDIGLPIQTDDQGRSFRPLVAYHIVDMDGRLNLNAHGSHGDRATGSAERHGIGVGPADISLNLVTSNYESLLDSRYGSNNLSGDTDNSITQGQKLFGHPVAPQYLGGHFASALPFLSESTLSKPIISGVDSFPHFVASTVDLTTDPKLNANPYASDFSLGGGAGDSLFSPAELESIYRSHDADGELLGGRLYDDFSTVRDNAEKVTTESYEIAIPATPRSIIDLLRDRVTAAGFTGTDVNAVVREFITGELDPANRYISTEMLMGGRFDLNRPLGNGIDDDFNGVVDDATEVEGINQSTTGFADPRQQVHNNPVFDLDNASNGRTGDSAAKAIMARQLYILALLVGGDAVLPNPVDWGTAFPEISPEITIPGTGQSHLTGTSADLNYRKSVAQWAVNMVDYRDSDSIITVFEYDTNPFNDPRTPGNVVDGNPATTTETDRGVVYGVERPELLITETIAVHDRQLQNVATEVDDNFDDGDVTGETTADGDRDWDNARVPNTAAYIELYHPWVQPYGTADGHQDLPREFATDPSAAADGVQLAKLAPPLNSGDMGTPVWRVVVLRGPNASVPHEAVRSIYFADPSDSDAPLIGDAFYPTGTPSAVAPGEYAVVGTSGNVAGSDKFTFGRLTSMVGDAPTATEISMTRSIELTGSAVVINGPNPGESVTRNCKTIVINRSVPTGTANARGLSFSDPDGGYSFTNFDVETDGIMLTDGAFPPANQAKDTPFDAVLPTPGDYRDEDDIDAIWTNGVMTQERGGGSTEDYQFRVIHLQRLANPNLAYDIDTNPYITVDVANVDLLAFNGLADNPDNGASAESGLEEPMSPTSGILTPHNGTTEMGGVERGEKIADDNGKATARRNLFRYTEDRVDITGDVAHSAGDGHTFSYSFVNGAERLETLGGRNESHNETVQFGWLAWNNRPYANHMEIANVPMLSAEGLVRYFGETEATDSPMVTATETSDRAFSYFFGNDNFHHLPGFGGVSRNGATEATRFDLLLDFLEVRNRFIGSESWLSANVTGTTAANPNALLFNLNAPFNSIPNFRYPGKINLNTIYSQDVWNALVRGFGDMSFATFRTNRSTPNGPTDIGGLYTSTEGSEFVEPGRTGIAKGQAQNLFRGSGTAREFDGVNELGSDGTTEITDTLSGAAFRNEVRTRLGGLTTTRSSVYAFWITIGYFEVDAFGRVGAELGADDGSIRRDRAFYMVDRSIPVACEPGKNHNVDQAVLVRTIIE